MDSFELMQPIAFIRLGSTLRLNILEIKTDWIVWYWEKDGAMIGDIIESQIISEYKGDLVYRYFKDESKEGGKLFYMKEITLMRESSAF